MPVKKLGSVAEKKITPKILVEGNPPHSKKQVPISSKASPGKSALTLTVAKAEDKIQLNFTYSAPGVSKKKRGSSDKGKGSLQVTPVSTQAVLSPKEKKCDKQAAGPLCVSPTPTKGDQTLAVPPTTQSVKKQTPKKNLAISGGDLTKASPAKEIQSMLECPICTAIPIGPIFNCVNGHSVCGDCQEKILCCGICRGDLTNSRNFVAEKLVATSKIACQYREKGCSFISTGDKLKTHLVSCKFRPVQIKCIYGEDDECNFSVVLKDNYIAHLSDVHHANKLEQTGGKFFCKWWTPSRDYFSYSTSTGYVENPVYVLFDGKTFIPYYSEKRTSIHLGLQILESESEAKKYKVRMIFTKPKEACKNSFLDIIVPVVSIYDGTEEDIDASMHCMISRPMLLRFGQEKMEDDEEVIAWDVHYEIILAT